MSVVFHSALLALLIFAPQWTIFQPSPEEVAQAEQQRLLAQQRERENRTFVFVKPRVDLEAEKPPARAELSDKDRIARAPQIAPNPQNPMPFSRGNSTERVEESQQARAGTPEPVAPPSPEPEPAPPAPEEKPRLLPPSDNGYRRPQESPRRMAGGSALGEALRNLDRYVQKGSFDNPQGGANQPGAAIQFDTKGVEFGPWIRRFVAQVKRNWFVPNAAWLLRGHVVLQFNIHKSGAITDIAVVGPSAVDAFNNAAYNAILTSNPTEPLPPEYPSDKALFTVTFFYNEEPPSGY